MSMLDYVRAVNAQQQFRLSDTFEFIEFDDLTDLTLHEDEAVPDELEIWAKVKVPYEGTLPESYRVLNILIGDWVEKNLMGLTDLLHTELQGHISEVYPESDSSELADPENTSIWTDQVDFMPTVNEEQKYIVVELEMVLEGEPLDD